MVCSDWLPSNYSFHQRFPGRVRAALQQCVDANGVPKNLQVAAKVVPKVFAVLSFPVSERDNVLLHAALGHELGHALVELHGIPVPRVPRHVDNALYTMNGYQRALTWCRELVADAWAVFLMGPAPFMSTYSLGRADPPDDEHPASYIRFLLMRECLQRTGFLRGEDALPDLEWLPRKIEDALKGAEAAQTSPAVQEAPLVHEVLRHNLGAIADFVLEKLQNLPSRVCSAEEWMSGCRPRTSRRVAHHRLVERLINHCPPDRYEVGKHEHTASLPLILTAGWAVLTSPDLWRTFVQPFAKGDAKRGQPDLTGDTKARQKLQGLVLKAVEICGVEREWEAAR
jgi:hypothetical protein